MSARFPLAAVCLLAAPLFAAAPALAATPLPDAVRQMVEHAAQGGDAARIAAVAAVARETNPDSVAEIDAIIARHDSAREAARVERLGHAGMFANWSGSGELGGSIATGNSDTVTLAAGLALQRDGLSWRHSLSAQADLQRSNGVDTQGRYLFGYQLDWKFNDRGYLLARLGWERNQVAGLRSRFTEVIGAGYILIDNPSVRLAVEGGPALSQTRLASGDYENLFGGRLAGNFLWNWSEETRFTQEASYLFDNHNRSFLSKTALTTKLLGALSARLSYSLQHESDPPAGRKQLDTITRATLVYDF